MSATPFSVFPLRVRVCVCVVCVCVCSCSRLPILIPRNTAEEHANPEVHAIVTLEMRVI